MKLDEAGDRMNAKFSNSMVKNARIYILALPTSTFYSKDSENLGDSEVLVAYIYDFENDLSIRLYFDKRCMITFYRKCINCIH